MLDAYPSCRHAVVNGELKSIVIHGPEEEREGWISSPHPFRPLAVQELIQLGKTPEEAASIHKRELLRVALVFAGHSLDEADRMAEFGPQSEAGALGGAASEIERLKVALAAKDTEIEIMVEKFDKAYGTATAEVERLTAENATLAKRLATSRVVSRTAKE